MIWVKYRKFLVQYRFILYSLVAGSVLLPLLLILYVNVATKSRRYTEFATVPAKSIAVVFGAGVYPDGTLSPMLADRVDAAVKLYRQGRVRKLLMTGDNSTLNYDEVNAMKRYAMKLSVPVQDITLDYAGFSTYESCYRAKAIFGVTQAILVTQKYHLPRAVYTCQQLGIDVVGLGTPDWDNYGMIILPYSLREGVSTVKAMWQLQVTHPKPTFLGSFEGIK